MFCGNSFLPEIIRNLRGFGPSKERSGKPSGLLSIGMCALGARHELGLLCIGESTTCDVELGARHEFELCRRQEPSI